jgi:hypothetical protein
MMREVHKRMSETGQVPVSIRIHPFTKHQLEAELRARTSFNLAYTAKTAQDMVINKIVETRSEGRYKGHPLPGGWEIPVLADDHVPLGQYWVAVDGYDISRDRIGEKIPRGIIKGLSFN